jgi:hypothetical protein
MLRQLIIAVTAGTFLGTTLIPVQALAHHSTYWRPDPRAGRAGYYGGHYGSDCYRAANGRSICPDRY